MLLYFSMGFMALTRYLSWGMNSAITSGASFLWILVIIFVFSVWARDCRERDGKYR